jgi:hypothetical protein
MRKEHEAILRAVRAKKRQAKAAAKAAKQDKPKPRKLVSYAGKSNNGGSL